MNPLIVFSANKICIRYWKVCMYELAMKKFGNIYTLGRKLSAQPSSLKAKNPSSPLIQTIEDEINLNYISTLEQQSRNESLIFVAKVLENTKFFFSHAKRLVQEVGSSNYYFLISWFSDNFLGKYGFLTVQLNIQ